MAILIHNAKAGFNHEILEKFKAGIELSGQEVKTLRLKRGSLDGGRVIIRGNEAYLINALIPPYQPGNAPAGYDERRPRKLLLTGKELAELTGKDSKNGLTIVPISVYNEGRFLKVEIAIARTKKKFDKRETIKKRETEREIRRTLKNS